MKINSVILKRAEEYLQGLSTEQKAKSEHEAYANALEAAAEIGYGEPFDQEQVKMNALLKSQKSGRIACMAIWSFYHDFKMAEAVGRTKTSNYKS